MGKFEDLKQENILLANEIDRADQGEFVENLMELKRKLYTNKLEMIDILEFQDKKKSTSARTLLDRVDAMKPSIRYETGLLHLDNELYSHNHGKGFEVGSLIILGGQSGAGKSHIMLDILSNISKYSKAVFFNFEMGDRRLTERLKKRLHSEDQLNNFIINSETRDLDELLMEIKILAEDGAVFFAIDSKMKLEVKGNDAEYQKISRITKELSKLAASLDIIIFLINQISEENLKHGYKSFKGSGDQLYDADMALFLTIEDDGQRVLECTKNRQDERGFKIQLPRVRNDHIPVVETVFEYTTI